MADNGNWERDVLEKLVMASVKEQRKTRNWGIFFKILGFSYLFFILYLMLGHSSGRSEKMAHGGKHTAVVELQGVIASGKAANAESINESLRDAFKDKNTKGVILRINSPGGSPVQSGMINDEIRRLRAQYPNIPLYAVVDDICASGGYYVAVAADKIYVDKASLIGSIGVLMDGFGFTGTMEKLGVERRLLTAGENKGFMDPFSPMNPVQREHAQKMLADIHQQFIGVVKAGRGKRLHDTPELFTGLIWNGEQGVKLGLADALGSVDSVARDVIKAEELVDFTQREGFADRLAKGLGAGAASQVQSWFGLQMR
ncbi:MAG: S49 family peptidase [Chitinivorax sp.]|jgi:protease-4